MPTTRPRHVITETDDIVRALDDAAEVWPEDGNRRARLLAHLVERGHECILEDQRRGLSERRRAIEDAAGALTGVFGPAYLEDLRREWPE